MRNRLLSLAAVLAAAGAAAANPPGVADRPRTDGREPTPVARDYYEPQAVVIGFGSVPMMPAKKASPTLGDFATEIHDAVMNFMTVPLGTVPVEN
jgi:hypothetical protein